MSKQKEGTEALSALAALFAQNAASEEKASWYCHVVLDAGGGPEWKKALDADEVEQGEVVQDEVERQVVEWDEINRRWNAEYYRAEGAMYAWQAAEKLLREAISRGQE